jgi:hypothetical protein
MRIPDGYVNVGQDEWRFWAVPRWAPRIATVLEEASRNDGWLYRSKHGRTRRLELDGVAPAYLKRYHPYRWSGQLKDIARPSKPLRALVMSKELARAGFATAPVVVAGERRRVGVVRGGLLVTEEVLAPDLAWFLANALARGPRPAKCAFLRQLGSHVARVHDAGFYPGDLVPANVRVRGDAASAEIVLLDHDRTQAKAPPLALRSARRNLVQLNRFVIPGLTATDRWRVFRAYVAVRRLDEAASRGLARWVMAKTIERRRRFDGIAAAERMGFRAVMQADKRP